MIRQLQKDYIWNTIGVLLQNAVSPILLIVVARINGVYDVGLFSFAFSLAIIFWAIAMWGGRTYQVSDTTGQFTTQAYLAVRLILAVAVLIGAMLFCVLSGYAFEKTLLVIALVAMKVVESIADMLHGVLQRNHILYVAGIMLTVKAVMGILAFTVVDILTHDILWSSLSLTVTTLVVTVIFDWRQTRQLDSNVTRVLSLTKILWSDVLEIMKKCAPIFGMTLLAMLSLNIPRYFLDMYHEEELGFFGIFAMPITLLVMIVSFVLQPQVTQLARHLSTCQYVAFNDTIRRLMLITGVIGSTILLATALVGIPALTLLFDINFNNYYGALLIMVVGAIMNAYVGIYINIFVIMRRFKSQFNILLITNIILGIACIPVVDKWGLFGAAWLFTITNSVQVVMFIGAYLRLNREIFFEKN